MPSAALCLKRQQHSIRLGRRRRKERGDDDAEQHNFLSSAATAAAAATHTDMCRRDGKGRQVAGEWMEGETVNIDGT